MEKQLSSYERFQMERYGNILPENNNPLETEEFENGFYDQDRRDMQNAEHYIS